MKRRAFIVGLGGAAVWPVVANAQSRLIVGFLLSSSDDDATKPLLKAFHQGLSELGFVEGRDVLVEYRWANYQYDQLSALAIDLVNQQVNVIAASPPVAAALAAKAATQTIPIVFVTGADPIASGLVSSINRPGGNITGVTMFTAMLGTKNLELARALMPNADAIGLLLNPDNPRNRDLAALQADAQSLGQQLHILPLRRDTDIDGTFNIIAERKIEALFIGSDSLFFARREELIARATKLRVPVIAETRDFAWAGALFSYGTRASDGYHTLGVYVARILKGAKPGELPVLQPTKFEFVINLKTAKVLGLDVPPTVLARADEVIE